MWEIAPREVVQVQGKFSYQGYKETKEIFVLCASNKPTNIYQKPLQCKTGSAFPLLFRFSLGFTSLCSLLESNFFLTSSLPITSPLVYAMLSPIVLEVMDTRLLDAAFGARLAAQGGLIFGSNIGSHHYWACGLLLSLGGWGS